MTAWVRVFLAAYLGAYVGTLVAFGTYYGPNFYSLA